MSKLTPMMQQYVDIKKEHNDSILFFRLGDFYEMFFEDAEIASRELEITLTQRGIGLKDKAAMCGIPHHVADTYVARLVEKGYKVAICDQVEDAAEAKGIVKREVVKVVTPGTITDQNILDEKSNNYLASIFLDSSGIGISYVDNSTGELYTTNYFGKGSDLTSFAINEISKVYPSEIICNKSFYEAKDVYNTLKNNLNPYFNVYEDSEVKDLNLKNIFESHFHPIVLDNIDSSKRLYSNIATGKLLDYLEITQKGALEHISDINFYEPNNYMVLDFNTRINLEIHETIMSRDKKGSLVGFLDKTSTSMGGRLLKRWLEQPLINKKEIKKRSNIVNYLVSNLSDQGELKILLRKVYDIERLGSKISTGNCNGRDLISLKNSLAQIPKIKEILKNTGNEGLLNLQENMDDLEDIHNLIDISIKDNPPILITEGGLIKKGYDDELDKIKNSATEGKEWLSNLESKEKEASGINNLKIGFNRVHGYFFEVTNSHIPKVPDHFIRRQTLTNSERYYTDELKEMEDRILGAEEKLLDFEYKVFLKIRDIIKREVPRIQKTSQYISTLDVLNSFAQISSESSFVKPDINNEGIINIKAGRHPVVEENIENNLFISNDAYLDLDNDMIQIITGPNMSGKSTYMRQIAIITLLAHIGCFVPADEANISIVDRIFTRIGAADNLSQGASTFMVEMNEVANIVDSATNRSLIILDEVGRGTSTYDGLSIAWALVEFIAEEIKAKTLFATHYHELTNLEEEYSQIKNLTIIAEEKGEDIVFLRKVVEGSTNKSYGIQVARLAGVSQKIINRAREVLFSIESNNSNNDLIPNEISEIKEDTSQLDLSDYRKNLFLESLQDLDTDNMTPKMAHDMLVELINEAKELKGESNE